MPDEIDRMFRWLHTDQVGCRFAMALTVDKNKDRWRAISGRKPRSSEDVLAIQETLEEACTESTDAVILIFKDVELIEDLIQMINLLCDHDSWRSVEDKFPEPSAAGRARIGLGLRWKMPCNTESFALGFGPFGFLPPTRRAPYTSLTLPVCTQGAFRDGSTEERHLCDMANEAFNTQEKWDGLWQSTVELKAKIIDSHDAEAAKAKVTFALPETCRQYLRLS